MSKNVCNCELNINGFVRNQFIPLIYKDNYFSHTLFQRALVEIKNGSRKDISSERTKNGLHALDTFFIKGEALSIIYNFFLSQDFIGLCSEYFGFQVFYTLPFLSNGAIITEIHREIEPYWHTDEGQGNLVGRAAICMNEYWDEKLGGLLTIGQKIGEQILPQEQLLPIGNRFGILKFSKENWHYDTEMLPNVTRQCIAVQLYSKNN